MSSPKKILLSGIKPTGRPHIGNYFGAMKQFVELQDQGYDTPQVTELAWIFNCLATMPYLMRAHAYKDAEAKDREINVGVFDYPILMAADILIADPDVVPVGQDQKQHVEIARDMAAKFNAKFGETFKLPKEMITESVAVVPGTDGQKMSKSYKNTIPLFATDEELKKLVMSIVTDSGSETIQPNIFGIHKLFRSEAYLVDLYEQNKGKYKILKEALLADLIAFIAPLRERRAEIAKDREAVLAILKEGGIKAQARAEKKMEAVRKAIGTTL